MQRRETPIFVKQNSKQESNRGRRSLADTCFVFTWMTCNRWSAMVPYLTLGAHVGIKHPDPVAVLIGKGIDTTLDHSQMYNLTERLEKNKGQEQPKSESKKRRNAPIGSHSSTTALWENVARKGGHRNQGQEKPRHPNTTCHQRGDPGLRQRAVWKKTSFPESARPLHWPDQMDAPIVQQQVKTWTEATRRLSYQLCKL